MRGLFRWGKFWGGENPPTLEIPQLRLPHAHPRLQAHAPLTIRKPQIKLPLKAAVVHDI